MALGELDAAQALRQRMAHLTRTGASDWYLVAKARQGMQVAAFAAREQTGRAEAVTQLFTCVTAVDPLLVAGLAPRYAEVSPHTLRIDAGKAPVTGNTAVVVLQNTFGMLEGASSVALRDVARGAGALLLEDSAHCVGRLERDDEGAPVADVSIHSFGVEKILPGTYFGGAVWVNPQAAGEGVERVKARLRAKLAALPPIDAKLDKATRSYRNQMRVITRLPGGAAARLRDRWERKGAFEPAVSEQERRGGTNHEPSRPSEWICEQALAALGGLGENEARRRACVAAYLSALDGAALRELRVPRAACMGEAQPLLRFPAFASGEQTASAAARAVAQLGYYAPAWPRPLLVPGVLDPVPYGLANGTDAWPLSSELSAGVIALPTDIDPAAVPAVVDATLAVTRAAGQ